MFALKPDTLNGKKIYRTVETGPDGANHVNQTIFLPPTIKFGEPRFQPWDELFHTAMAQLITVADHTDPVLAEQARLSKARLAKHQAHWINISAVNERARIRDELRKLGFAQAAEAIKNG